MKIEKPWGSYTVLAEGKRFKAKLIEVLPHKRLSLQFHHHRSEHWVVVQGRAKVTKGEKEYFLDENESIYIPKEGIHRLENLTDTILKVVEVQSGECLEEDIERLKDDYKRLKCNA